MRSYLRYQAKYESYRSINGRFTYSLREDSVTGEIIQP